MEEKDDEFLKMIGLTGKKILMSPNQVSISGPVGIVVNGSIVRNLIETMMTMLFAMTAGR